MRLTLASALAVIGRDALELETKATSVLRIVKTKKIKDARAWNAAVRAAYKANGWNGKPGKPKDGEKREAVPATVKQYVSAVRTAFRLKLPVAGYSSFYALRQDLVKERAKRRKPRANGRTQPQLVGITLKQPDVMIGGEAVFHDLVAVYGALDRTRKPKLVSAVQRIVREFSGSVPQLIVASLPEMRKAA